jgi:hypothetical protein
MSYAQHFPTAREADREHGLVAGAMTGAWTLANELEAMFHTMQGRRPTNHGAPPDPQPTSVENMAIVAVEQHARARAIVSDLKQLLSL